uniref:Uncharacterized protein CG3556-like n=1 Tax=Saccoglossus kowalevskii TaxID=10224 RepID=A0ABM0GNY2_SACKO|nr:PREDICTED: uncharacterized protein CG3556-like [Saccoglossus kowalevskii]
MAKLITVFLAAVAISLSLAETTVEVTSDKPALTVVPSDRVVALNQTATFECAVTGNLAPIKFWQKYGKQGLLFPDQVEGRLAVTAEGELQISHVRREDEGDYICTAMSSSLTLTAKAHLTVIDSETNDERQRALNLAYTKASEWLKSQQNDQWGWEHTPSVILSLQLTNQTWFNRTDLGVQMNIKQLEIELLTFLSARKRVPSYGSKDELKELSPGHLAYFILALHSTCHNVEDFFGHDLIRLLEHKMHNFPVDNFNNHFQYSLALLALCNTKSLVKHRYVQDVANGQDIHGGYFYDDKDTTAMVVTAMSCLANRPQFANDTTVNSTLQRGISNLISCQHEEGSFGNVHSTALAYQALVAARVPPSKWQPDDVLSSILAEQEDDGSFNGHLMTTMQVLPSLVGKHYSDINTEMCNIKEQKEEQDAIKLHNPNSSEDTITVNITVIDAVNNGNTLASYSVNAPPKTSLYSIMEGITDLTFEATDSAWGHYIQSMFGIRSDNVKQTYWAIYKNYLETLAVGVDDYYPEDGDHVIFKFVNYGN